jgi:hypothetical protein
MALTYIPAGYVREGALAERQWRPIGPAKGLLYGPGPRGCVAERQKGVFPLPEVYCKNVARKWPGLRFNCNRH